MAADQDASRAPTRGVVSTAVPAARHPVSTAAVTVGFVKGAAGTGVGLFKAGVTGHTPQPTAEDPGPLPASTPTETEAPEPTVVVEVPERDLPGPDIVLAAVPDPEDLPEPIVIEAIDDPDPVEHEAFHTEPKATTRADSIGGEAADVLEAEDEVDEALEESSGVQRGFNGR